MVEFLAASATEEAVIGLGDGFGAEAELVAEPHAATRPAAIRETTTSNLRGLENESFMT